MVLTRVIEEVDNQLALGRWYVEENCRDIPSAVLENINLYDVGYEVDQYELEGKFCDIGYVYEECPLTHEVYDGSILPDFDYLNDSIAKVKLTNLDDCRSVHLKLPAGKYNLERACKDLGCGMHTDENISIDHYVTILGTSFYIDKSADLDYLNHICSEIAAMNDEEVKKLGAILEYVVSSDEANIYQKYGLVDDTIGNRISVLLNHMNDFDYFEGINSPSEYAYHLATELKVFDIGEELIPYVNFNALGSDWVGTEGGIFVSSGYVIDETPDLVREHSEELEI